MACCVIVDQLCDFCDTATEEMWNAHLLEKGHRFAHEVPKDPAREGVEGGSEGHTAHQEDDVCGGQVCCTLRKTNRNGLSQTHTPMPRVKSSVSSVARRANLNTTCSKIVLTDYEQNIVIWIFVRRFIYMHPLSQVIMSCDMCWRGVIIIYFGLSDHCIMCLPCLKLQINIQTVILVAWKCLIPLYVRFVRVRCFFFV